MWVLLLIVTFVTVKTSIQRKSQLRLAESDLPVVSRNSTSVEDSSVDLCIVFEQSCDIYGEMACLTAEQKAALKCIYKTAKKLVHSESHIQFLEKCLELRFIPKSFQVKKYLPGNQKINRDRFEKVSFDCINDEKESHTNKLAVARAELSRNKRDLKFRSRRWGSSLPGLRKQDPPLSPPST